MANTTWSATDKTASVTLSGANLVATSSGGNQAGRSVDSKTTGKYYWEVNATTLANFGNTQVGVANGTTSITAFAASSGSGGCVLDRSGNLFSNGSTITGSAGGLTQGVAAGVALDLTNLRVWIRGGPAAFWNGNSSANPATNIGGVDISAYISGSAPGFAVYALAGSGDVLTANFGDSAFSGTVPAGFTSGLPGPPTSARLTQISLEQWASIIPPQMQATQLAVEIWGSTTTTTTRMLTTQMAIEQWSSVAPASSARTSVIILA